MILSSTKLLSSFFSWANAGRENKRATALLVKNLEILTFRCIFIYLVFQFFCKFYFSFINNNVFDILLYEFQRGNIIADFVFVYFKKIQMSLIGSFIVVIRL